MKAKKYRIGNFVQINNKTIKLTPKYFKSFGVFKDIEPLILNEQWLIDFGFTNTNTIEFPNYEKLIYKCFVRNDRINFCNQHGFIKNLKYVHELQNLFFAIEGKELIYSKTKT
jgi:hypothetical protein